MMVIVFRSRVKDAVVSEFTEHAARIDALAHDMPGFVGRKVFTAEDGERVTIIEFRSAADLEN